MIRISISGDDWSVTATVHEEDVDNPFDGCNQDRIVACAIQKALGLASYCLWNNFYVLANVVANIDESQIRRLQAAERAFIAAAAEYCRIAEETA